MINPERVARNFSRDPDAYERLARVQRRAAADLAAMILANFAERHQPKRVLELGCGTGFLTRRLLPAWPEADFIVSDLSPAMVEFCRKRLARACRRRPGVCEFRNCDAAGKLPIGPFDLITAALVGQWIPDLSAMFRGWQRELAPPRGRIAFSLVVDGTFAGIHALFEAAGVKFPTPPLHTEDEVRQAVVDAKLTILEWRNESRRERYPCLRDFLQHLRAVGAGNAVAPPLPPPQLRRVLHHAGNRPVAAAYQVVSGVVGVQSLSRS